MSHEQSPESEAITDDIDHVHGHSWFFDAQTVQVSITGGKETLSGTVRSQRERRMAAAAACAYDGVTVVENDLVVAEA